jgi:hypothetical protein
MRNIYQQYCPIFYLLPPDELRPPDEEEDEDEDEDEEEDPEL